MRLLIFALFLVTTGAWALDFHDFDAYQYQFTKEEMERRIQTYLKKDPEIAEFYQITSNTLIIGSPQAKPDYVLQLATSSHQAHRNEPKRKGLQGAKIAIDPGHFGGSLAELEERYISAPANEAGDQPIAFDEGTLTYLTALELQSLLEAEGAVVFLTRTGIGKGAIKQSFPEWLEEHPSLRDSQDSSAKLFRDHYNRADLYLRAAHINAFSPDLTIILHYNSYLSAQEKKRRSYLTQANFSLLFVPGAFCAGELSRVEDRYEFLRMLLTNAIDKSVEFGKLLTSQFIHQLKVPLIKESEKTSYITNACLLQDPGIYARNLVLTRLVHSPLCYGETLVQNNQEEVYRLSNQDVEIGGVRCSHRLKEVATAYFEAIKTYFQ